MLMSSSDSNNSYVNIEFSFVGESFDLNYVTDLMRIRPTSSFFERIIQGNKETSWTISTRKIITLDVNDAVAEMLKLLLPLEETINKIQNSLKVYSVISIDVYEGDNGIPGIWFSNQFIEFSHTINVKFIDVDIRR